MYDVSWLPTRSIISPWKVVRLVTQCHLDLQTLYPWCAMLLATTSEIVWTTEVLVVASSSSCSIKVLFQATSIHKKFMVQTFQLDALVILMVYAQDLPWGALEHLLEMLAQYVSYQAKLSLREPCSFHVNWSSYIFLSHFTNYLVIERHLQSTQWRLFASG